MSIRNRRKRLEQAAPGADGTGLDETRLDDPVCPALELELAGAIFPRLSTGILEQPFNIRVEINDDGDIRLDYAYNEFGSRRPRAGVVIELGDRRPGFKHVFPYAGGDFDVPEGSGMVLYWEMPPHRMYRTPVSGQLEVLEVSVETGMLVRLDLELAALDGRRVHLRGLVRFSHPPGDDWAPSK